MESTNQALILIVDDNITNLKVLSNFLKVCGFKVLVAKDGENCLQRLEVVFPDLILLDVLMPGIDGFETCRRLKNSAATKDIPVIFMTALSDAVDRVKGLTIGAVDYITKPIQHDEAIARINIHLQLRSLTKELEERNRLLQQEIRDRELAEKALRESERQLYNQNVALVTLARNKALNRGDLKAALREIMEVSAQTLEISRSSVWLYDDTGSTLQCLDLFERDINLHSEGFKLPATKAPSYFRALAKDQAIIARDVYQDPRMRELTEFYFAPLDIISLLDTPIRLGGQIIGVMCLEVTRIPRDWTFQEQNFAVSLTDLISLAIEAKERKRAEVANLAKSQFLGKMSHELKTPLNAVLGFTQLLIRNPFLEHKTQQEYLEIIRRTGESLLSSINDVLEMSKIETGQVAYQEKGFDLFDLLNSVEQMFASQALSKGLRFTIEKRSDIPQYVKTDEKKLSQVLMNLLGNAIKYTYQGFVRMKVGCKDDKLLLEIEDSSPGIALEEIELIFEAFAQTETGKKSQQGMGLGLAISREFVWLMGGDISVSSEVGKGTNFKFDIQISQVTAADIQPKITWRRAIALEPDQPVYRLLVVENNRENRQLLAKMLECIGFEVREAENGREAIAIWESWEPQLIWMDMRMPMMNGYEATKQIRSQVKGQATAIIALISSRFDEDREVILSAGCDDLVHKPFQEDEISEKLVKHLGVRFIYEDPTQLSQPVQSEPHLELTAESLTVMPAEWVANLNQAALTINNDTISALIAQIPAEHEDLARGLKHLVDNFRYDILGDLTG